MPAEVWRQLLARMSVDGAKLFGTTNPDSPAHWLRKEYLLRADDPGLNLRHWHFVIDDNPGLSRRKIAEYKASFTGLFYKRFIEGRWVAAEGAIFDNWDEDRHIIHGELPLIERWISCGIDYGTRNPFAAVLLGMDVHQRLVVTSEYRYDSKTHRRQKSPGEYREDLVAWLARHPIPGTAGTPDPYTGQPRPQLYGVRPEYIVVDPAASVFIVELQHNSDLSPAGADNSVLDGIRLVSTLLARDRLLVHESCKGLISEFPGYSWDDRETLVGRDVPIKVDDHSLDALRYAVNTTEAVWRPFVLEYA
jgi:PBSX family phage terminase large subunit